MIQPIIRSPAVPSTPNKRLLLQEDDLTMSNKRASSSPRKATTYYHAPIQFAACLGVCWPPLALSAGTFCYCILVFLIETLLDQHVLPIVTVAVVLVLLGRTKIRSLARTKASYDRAMQTNTVRLPAIALTLAIVICRGVEKSLLWQRVWGTGSPSFSIQLSSTTLGMLVHVVFAMSILACVVVVRFVPWGVYRARFYLRREHQLRFWKSSINTAAEESELPTATHGVSILNQDTTMMTSTQVPSNTSGIARPATKEPRRWSLPFTIPLRVWLHVGFTMLGAVACAFTLREVTKRFIFLRVSWNQSLLACAPPLIVDMVRAVGDTELDPSLAFRTAFLRPRMGFRVAATVGMIVSGSLLVEEKMSLLVYLVVLGVGCTVSAYSSFLDGANRYCLFTGTRSFPEAIVEDALVPLQLLLQDPSLGSQLMEESKRLPDRISMSPDLQQIASHATNELKLMLQPRQPLVGLEDDVFWWGNLNAVLNTLNSPTSRLAENLVLIRGLCILLWSYGLALHKQGDRITVSPTTVAVHQLILRSLDSLFGQDAVAAHEYLYVAPSILKTLHMVHQGLVAASSSQEMTTIVPLCHDVAQRILQNCEGQIRVEHLLDAECVHWLHPNNNESSRALLIVPPQLDY